MKQGESKRLQPKDKHSKESRDAGRKGKQEAYVLGQQLFAQFEEDHLGVVPDSQDDPDTTNGPEEGAEANG